LFVAPVFKKRDAKARSLATQEAEIKRIMVPSQLGKIVCQTLFPKYPTQKQVWWSGSSAQVRE
jgi:hypothetical protein